jgi:hypothetical protein
VAAGVFKSICAHYKLGQDDTSRTADISSVLRPIGTNNDKTAKGLGVKPVKLMGTPNLVPVKFKSWVAKLSQIKKDLGLTVAPPSRAPVSGINDDLGGGLEFEPASAEIIADKCNQIRLFRDNKGVGQSEPLWRICLGAIKHAVDGPQFAHEWSSGHPGYTQQDTEEKLSNWNSGPATCESFKSINPAGCAGCEFSVKAPIRLGAIQPPVVSTVTYVSDSGEEAVEELGTLPAVFEGKFRKGVNGLSAYEKDEKNDLVWGVITSSIPEVIDYYRDVESGQYRAVIRAYIKPGVYKEAEIDAKVFGQGGSALLGALCGSLMISIKPGKLRSLERYMHMWIEEIKRVQAETAMFTHMGWYDDGSFLYGDKQYLPSGEIKTIKLKPTLRKLADSMVPTGDLDRYKQLVNRAYNHPNHEEFQFTYLAGFASILLHIIHPKPIGIVFNAWSRKSGAGKSTASKLAVGIWSKTDIVDADGTTPLALTITAGMHRNLPMVLDEATNWKGEKIGEFAYRYSSGIAKIQAKADGGLRDNSDINWCNFLLTSGNKPMSENMSMVYSNAAPQMARVWQYRFTEHYTSAMSSVEGAEVFQELMEITGVAGEVFLPYVVQNRAALFDELNRVGADLMSDAHLERDGRNWKMGAACVLVAGKIAQQLGLHKFDMVALRGWVIARLRDLKSISSESVRDLSDMFSSMVAELHGGFIVTYTMGDTRAKQVAHYVTNYGPPHGAITGRVSVNTGEMYISTKAVIDWCKKNDVSYSEMKAIIESKGWLKDVAMVRLGTGTDTQTPPTRCLCLATKAFGHLNLVKPSEPLNMLEEAV